MPDTFPSLSPASVYWELVPNPQRSLESPLNRSVQTVAMPGEYFMATLSFPIYQEDDARTLIAFLSGLRGSAGRFYLHDHSLETPRGVATGTPLVKGASQTGLTLESDGWTVSQTGILKAGDMFGFGTELHMLKSDVNSDAGGNASLVLVKPIRTSPSDNAPITTSSPKATMMLLEGNHAQWRVKPGNVYDPIVFTCRETWI